MGRIIIDAWDESSFDDAAIKAVRKHIDEHNKNAQELLDSSGQEVLAVVTSCGGLCVGIVMSDPDMAHILSVGTSGLLQKIIDEHYSEVSTAVAQKQADMDALREELIELIISDPEFAKCTNKIKRKAYILNFQKSRRCDKYRDLFKTITGREVQYMYTGLVEAAWEQYSDQGSEKSEVWLFGEKV